MEKKNERVGVYVCHCGSNIAGVVDVVDVAKWAQEKLGPQGVIIAREYKFMCSSLGQELIEKDIKELGLTRVVVAACSPHLHEKTFRTAAKNAGLNPYLVELASIREQVSWVHTDKAVATEKSKAVVSGAVSRVIENTPLDDIKVPINPNTLIVGGGIAGIQSALEIANAGFHVYLVEREPSIGGHMAQFDKTFPTLDCSACILTPRMVEAGTHPNITLLTWSEVVKVTGFVGNFNVTIKKKARFINEELCTGCGICQEKCPKKVIDDVYEAGLGYRKAVYTPFAQAVPNFPVMDKETCTYFIKGTCKACEKFCPTGAIDFKQEDQLINIDVGNIVLATGYDLFDARRVSNYGYGRRTLE
jgi:heterodisulfide reductase subunit A